MMEHERHQVCPRCSATRNECSKRAHEHQDVGDCRQRLGRDDGDIISHPDRDTSDQRAHAPRSASNFGSTTSARNQS
jgi:hypothetical protein